MVEGGARIINSFLQQNSLIDALIVTVAPTLVGADGVSYASAVPSGVCFSFHPEGVGRSTDPFLQIPHLLQFDTQVVGHDAVLILKSTSA
jgi:2,5-diamino-6-(ribosylamino)-4(3H)-pyrimidinone 5'-phosphate reductase